MISTPDETTPDADLPPAPSTRQVIQRRAVLAAAAAIGLGAAHAALRPAHAAERSSAPADPTRVPGKPPSAYGERSPFEHAVRLAGGPRSLTPLQELHGIITPASLHFERHHNGVPAIDPARHRLLVHGLVERAMAFTMEDLQRFPSVSRIAFIECSGNSAAEWKKPSGGTAQDTHGLTSTSEWTGVPLAILLREVGLNPDAAWMLAEGSDAAAMTRSVPVKEVIDEALLC